MKNNPPRIPGRIVGDRLIKSVKARNRMNRPFPGWGLSIQQLREAQAAGARLVELRADTGEVFTASVSRIFSEGCPMKYLNFEPQLLVPLTAWQIADSRQGDLFGGEA